MRNMNINTDLENVLWNDICDDHIFIKLELKYSVVVITFPGNFKTFPGKLATFPGN